jgi:hypothetical protein
MKAGPNMNEALTFLSQTVDLPGHLAAVSQAFSDMLSGRIRFFLAEC